MQENENLLRCPDRVCDHKRRLSGNYKIAGLDIHIETRYSLVQDQCAEYRTAGVPAISVQCDQEDIDDEREKAARLNEPDDEFLRRCPDSYIESIFKQRLMDNILRKDYASVSAIHSGEWQNRLTKYRGSSQRVCGDPARRADSDPFDLRLPQDTEAAA